MSRLLGSGLPGALLVVVAAVAIAVLLRAGPVVGRMQTLSREARSQWPTLNDDGREALSRRMAAGMGGLCLRITAILIAALGTPLLALWLLDRARLVAFDKVIATSLSPGFLVATTLAGGVLAWMVAHRPAPAVDGWRHGYSRVERLLHVLAFATWPLQVALADIEVVVFARELRGLEAKRPVFVAGLPRAGTTLLLQLLEATGEFASYRYRDMPFLLAPMFWRALSPRSRDLVAPQARAHGDGVEIGIESPEAFEEVLWRTFHPERYRNATLPLWGRQVDRDFPEAFRSQMRKLIAIRRTDAPNATRYLSKNNGNIARLAAVAAMFPDAVVLAPYRDPLAHAASLLRQHLNFLELHGRDDFSRRYMEAIGHYDFGANLKPIAFDDTVSGDADFTRLETWLDYWSAAYEHLLSLGQQAIVFISYEALCDAPAATLAALADRLGLAAPGGLTARAGEVWPSRAADEPQVDAASLERARAIQARLDAVALSSSGV
ncbi:hypothetical protein BH10PSE5_BH10PSE5_03210 [soil metagenome]